jgi:putative transposase
LGFGAKTGRTFQLAHCPETQRHATQQNDYNLTMKYRRAKAPVAASSLSWPPYHVHMLWRLPDGDGDYATRWRLIKSHFTRRWPGSRDYPATLSRQSKGERSVWQRRYWEHLIRDEVDWRRHVDYIHYNPVKHGLARAPGAWQFSSFHIYMKQGYYPLDWGAGERVEVGMEAGVERVVGFRGKVGPIKCVS